jgi:hypothetical protein
MLKVKQTMLVSSCKSYVSPKKKARFLDGYKKRNSIEADEKESYLNDGSTKLSN